MRTSALVSAALWVLLAPLAQASTIGFDSLAPGAVVTNQFPEATFSSSPGNVNRAHPYNGPPGNMLCTGPAGWLDNCIEDTYIDFTQPVDNLTFWAIAANCVCVSAQFNVFQAGVQTATVFLTGTGNPSNVLVDLSAYPRITRLEIVNIIDDPNENGIGWDTFSFTESSITPLCFGDGSLSTPCPCSNFGAAGHGCANSQAGSAGATLAGAGPTSPDAVVLTASEMLPTVPCIFFQGESSSATGLVFGDGVRCASTPILRLSIKIASGGTAIFPDASAGDPSIHARCAALGSPIPPGATRYYQTYYRDPDMGFCPSPAGDTWNVTGAVRILWP